MHAIIRIPLLCIFATFLLAGFAVAAEKSSGPPSPVPAEYDAGMKKYQANCSVCHGVWGKGSKMGPSLVHPYYKPSHHGDPAIYRAALKGARAHHWKFGDMPAVKGITTKDMDAIVPFIRWFQRESGIK